MEGGREGGRELVRRKERERGRDACMHDGLRVLVEGAAGLV